MNLIPPDIEMSAFNYVYILRSLRNGSVYFDCTSDLRARLVEPKADAPGAFGANLLRGLSSSERYL